MTDKTALRVRIGSTDDLLDGREILLQGRVAWTARHLINAGARGVTTAQLPPGVRVSDSIMKLRRAGVDIETQHEGHSGDYPGRHGRYLLRSRLEVLEDVAR